MNPIEAAARKIPKDLKFVGARWALVGGLAVSARAGGRATTDLDVAVAVEDDKELDRIVFELRKLGYGDPLILMDKESGRTATIRLPLPNSTGRDIVLDLLACTTGIEPEIVAGAEPLDPFPRMKVPVASRGHLIAMKVFSEKDDRLKDRIDLQSLLADATDHDLRVARAALDLMKERRPPITKDLTATLDKFVADFWGRSRR